MDVNVDAEDAAAAMPEAVDIAESDGHVSKKPRIKGGGQDSVDACHGEKPGTEDEKSKDALLEENRLLKEQVEALQARVQQLEIQNKTPKHPGVVMEERIVEEQLRVSHRERDVKHIEAKANALEAAVISHLKREPDSLSLRAARLVLEMCQHMDRLEQENRDLLKKCTGYHRIKFAYDNLRSDYQTLQEYITKLHDNGPNLHLYTKIRRMEKEMASVKLLKQKLYYSARREQNLEHLLRHYQAENGDLRNDREVDEGKVARKENLLEDQITEYIGRKEALEKRRAKLDEAEDRYLARIQALEVKNDTLKERLANNQVQLQVDFYRTEFQQQNTERLHPPTEQLTRNGNNDDHDHQRLKEKCSDLGQANEALTNMLSDLTRRQIERTELFNKNRNRVHFSFEWLPNMDGSAGRIEYSHHGITDEIVDVFMERILAQLAEHCGFTHNMDVLREVWHSKRAEVDDYRPCCLRIPNAEDDCCPTVVRTCSYRYEYEMLHEETERMRRILSAVYANVGKKEEGGLARQDLIKTLKALKAGGAAFKRLVLSNQWSNIIDTPAGKVWALDLAESLIDQRSAAAQQDDDREKSDQRTSSEDAKETAEYEELDHDDENESYLFRNNHFNQYEPLNNRDVGSGRPMGE